MTLYQFCAHYYIILTSIICFNQVVVDLVIPQFSYCLIFYSLFVKLCTIQVDINCFVMTIFITLVIHIFISTIY